MKIVKFLGGLGNQMFQYAFYMALKQQFKNVKADITDFTDYKPHNGFELEKVFDIRLDLASDFEIKLYTSNSTKWVWRKLRRLYGAKNAYSQEREEFGFDNSIFAEKRNRYYWGYWQHVNYIMPVETQLRNHFSFPPLADSKNVELGNKIKASNSVSVHIRRGDYLGHSILGGICDREYYKRAINLIKENIHDPLFVFFSNDVEWCRENFSEDNIVFVDWNQADRSFIDMDLMSRCKHNIIANSSFSWWGAWLNNSPGKMVVSPSRWVNNTSVDVSGLILPEFIQI